MKRQPNSFHLLLGDRWRLPFRTNLLWSGQPLTLRLKPKPERIRRTEYEGRRGVAADRQGRIYWISPDGTRIWVQHPEGNRTPFWPQSATEPGNGSTPDSSPFEPSVPPARHPRLVGLAVTLPGFLVAGMAEEPALLVFDLEAGSPPLRLEWTGDLTVLDLAPAPDGGLLLLEGGPAPRLWTLDRDLRAAHRPVELPASPEPLAVEPLPDGSWLLLAGDTVVRWRDGAPLPGVLSLAEPDRILPEVQPEPDDEPHGMGLMGKPPPPTPYDIAFDPETGVLYAATEGEAQCYAFRVTWQDEPFGGHPLGRFLPTPNSRGRGLLAASGHIWHDADDDHWVPLQERPHAHYQTLGVCATRTLDGKEPDCVWHRVLLDATIPPGTAIRVDSRCSDDRGLLTRLAWRSEPEPVLRPGWMDRPLHRTDEAPSSSAGTWELLLQQARGRYLQLRITFTGSGTATPELRALRVWYPRFSYLTHHLPAVYHNDSASASFLERYLANAEGVLTAVQTQIDQSYLLFRPNTVPTENLQWLAGWFGLVLGENWEEHRCRLLIRHAMQFFRFRGTLPGLIWALHVGLDPDPTERIFTSDLTPYIEGGGDDRMERPAFRVAENPPGLPQHTFIIYLDEEQLNFESARLVADQVLNLCKPAHTHALILPMQPHLALDRTRLGIDSRPAHGPARIPAALLGTSRLAGAYLSAGRPEAAPPRITVGEDRLEPNGRRKPDQDRGDSTHDKA